MRRTYAFALSLLVALCSSTKSSVNGFTIGTTTTQPTFARTSITTGSTASTTTPTSLYMASSMTRLPDSAVEVSITAPGAATQAAYDKACLELSKEITIKGFRKGSKIPPPVLENAMAAKGGRNALRVQAIQELAQLLVAPAIKDEHRLEPIGQPTLKAGAETLAETFVPGEDLIMVVRCDVWPDVTFTEDKAYLGLTGKYSRKPYDQAKFDVAMKDLRERYAQLEPIANDDGDYALVNGDSCQVNMVGYLATPEGTKGEPLPTDVASGDDVEVILGEGRYMEGLVEGLLGARVKEVRQIKVTFPDKLRDKNLAGRTALFDVTVESASKRTLPELDDAFANKVRPGLTMEALKQELQKAVDEEDAKEFVGVRNTALSKSLADVMDMPVPDTLVTQQAREKYAQMMTEFRDQGTPDEEIKRMISPENFLKYKDIYADTIRDEFKVSMAVEHIAQVENIEVPQYQIDEQMANLQKEQEKQQQEGGDEPPMDEAQMKQRVETTLQSKAVFEFLAENANLEVTYEEEEFDQEFMDKLAQDSLAREGLDPNQLSDIPDAEIVSE